MINGTPALKKAIAAKLKTDNDLTYDPSEIIVTPGGKQALFEAVMALVEPGAEEAIRTRVLEEYAHKGYRGTVLV